MQCPRDFLPLVSPCIDAPDPRVAEEPARGHIHPVATGSNLE